MNRLGARRPIARNPYCSATPAGAGVARRLRARSSGRDHLAGEHFQLDEGRSCRPEDERVEAQVDGPVRERAGPSSGTKLIRSVVAARVISVYVSRNAEL
jgi:hypothetical protein